VTSDGKDRGEEGKAAARGPDVPEPEIDSAQLMRGRRAIRIRHQGELYRLSITSKDRLILTK